MPSGRRSCTTRGASPGTARSAWRTSALRCSKTAARKDRPCGCDVTARSGAAGMREKSPGSCSATMTRCGLSIPFTTRASTAGRRLGSSARSACGEASARRNGSASGNRPNGTEEPGTGDRRQDSNGNFKNHLILSARIRLPATCTGRRARTPRSSHSLARSWPGMSHPRSCTSQSACRRQAPGTLSPPPPRTHPLAPRTARSDGTPPPRGTIRGPHLRSARRAPCIDRGNGRSPGTGNRRLPPPRTTLRVPCTVRGTHNASTCGMSRSRPPCTVRSRACTARTRGNRPTPRSLRPPWPRTHPPRPGTSLSPRTSSTACSLRPWLPRTRPLPGRTARAAGTPSNPRSPWSRPLRRPRSVHCIARSRDSLASSCSPRPCWPCTRCRLCGTDRTGRSPATGGSPCRFLPRNALLAPCTCRGRGTHP